MEKHAFHVWRYGAPLLVLAAGAAALWPFRHQLTAEAIAAFSPRQTVLASSFLVGLYALKSLSVCFPMSALTAAGGLLFPFPLALAVNLCGTGVAQTIPFFLGRREQGGLEALAELIRNDTEQPFQLCVQVGKQVLKGEWRAPAPPVCRYEIVERNHRMDQASWGGYVRHNELYRRIYDLEGGLLEEEFLFANDAIMMYSPLLPEES